MSSPDTTEEPLLGYPDCPACRRKCGWDSPGGWIACGACEGVGSTKEQMATAEAAWARAHLEWRTNNAAT